MILEFIFENWNLQVNDFINYQNQDAYGIGMQNKEYD
jgi:hypothetical protein